MAKISNETKLLLKLAHERMQAKRLSWTQRKNNPNTNSNNPDWLSGYEYAWTEWNVTLVEIAIDLETK